MENLENPSKIEVKRREGLWKRYFRLFTKSHLPFLWIAIFVAFELVFVNLGVDVTETTAELLAGDTSAGTLLKLILMIIADLVLGNLVIFTRQMASSRTDRNLRNVVFQKLLRLPMSFFKKENPRDGTYRIVANCSVLSNSIIFVIVPLITVIFKISKILGKVFKYDFRLTLVLVAFMPIQFFFAFLYGRINYWLSRKNAKYNAKLTNKLAEIITNIPVTKAFSKEESEGKRAGEVVDNLYKVSITGSWIDQLRDFSHSFVSLIQTISLTFVGYILFKNGTITTRNWIAFFAMALIFTGAVDEMVMYWNNVKTIQGSSDRVAEILYALEEKLDGEPCENLVGDIVVSSLYFGYEEDKEVLTDLNCTFENGKATALIGPSGCGKSTLCNLLMRMYEPASGSISISDKNVADYGLDSYRDQFAVVSQSTMLFSGTIFENIAYGNENATEYDVIEGLKRSGAWDFVSELPDGIYTKIEEYGENFSGGQKQKLSVARAMLSHANYIILDEPTSAMDAASTHAFLTTVKEVFAGKTIIIIGHTPMVFELAENVVLIEEGMVSYQGSKEHLDSTSEFVKSFLRKEASHAN